MEACIFFSAYLICLYISLLMYLFYGFKLGFWFAHQGAILVFVVLIFIYTWRMKALDSQFDVADSDDHPEKIS